MSDGTKISGIGAHRPARIVTNDEVCQRLDTDDAWIRRRTGIAERRVAAPDESVVEMAVQAGRKAIAAAGVDPGDIDLVVLATCSVRSLLPGGAASVAAGVGAVAAGAFDLNAACAGFCYGIGIAADAVRNGSARHVLVVGSERMSDLLDWDDRSSAILFGDGAGAALVSFDASGADGIGPMVAGADGALAPLIRTSDDGWLTLDGPAVFRWAVRALGDVARAICDRSGVDVAELAAFVPHQANLRIIDAVAADLGVDPERVARDVETNANTSAASIPLALCALVESGRLQPGGRALLLGFGAGLTWAGQIVTIG